MLDSEQGAADGLGPTPFSVWNRTKVLILGRVSLTNALRQPRRKLGSHEGRSTLEDNLHINCTWSLYKKIISSNAALRFFTTKVFRTSFQNMQRCRCCSYSNKRRPEPPSLGHAAIPRARLRTNQPQGPYFRPEGSRDTVKGPRHYT